LKNVSLILLAAGSSSRFNAPVKKQWIRIEEKPLWQFVADKFESLDIFDEIIITSAEDEITYMQYHGNYSIVIGGKSRQESLQNALLHVKSEFVLVSDIARACIEEQTLQKLFDSIENYDVVIPTLKISDTIIYDLNTIDRDKVLRVQTPQLSRVEILKKALQSNIEYTDESSAIVAIGGKRGFIEGDLSAHKLTFLEDITNLPCLKEPSNDILTGNGFDVHEFDATKSHIILCGKPIECGYGFKAHSDGDVAIHALIDAILGACGMGDIGELFPDNDAQYAGIDSQKLLQKVLHKVTQFGFIIKNVDITIIAQQPKIAPHKKDFRFNIAKLLNIEPIKVNIKATTTEKLGFIGRKEGVGVIATANLKYFNWKEGK